MLSKVLSRAEALRAQPAVFEFASTPPPRPAARDSDSAEEVRSLRARVQQLEAEIPAAKHDGFEAGRQQGEQKARAEIAAVIERLNASVAELTGLRHELRRRSESDVVKLATMIARRILHRELNTDTGALTALARVVFERLARAESYRVTLHPQFAPAVRAALSGRLLSRVEIEADPNCAPGTFMVYSDEGSIDASIDSQLDEIGRGLADRLGAPT
jgi:flagellar assembly protein FliH